MTSSNKPGSAPISLPSGGGSIRGVGETFQPSVFDGTGSFTVPIPISPGRGGFGPDLRLGYSSGNGNGIFGLGWALSIPNVTRKTEKGLPRYNAEDVFVLSGAEDLVPIPPSGAPAGLAAFTITAYRPRVEGLFARIEKWADSATGEEHWRVTTKDNVTSLYGRTSAARLSHPDNAKQVFQWLLEETFDSKGNHVLYEYAQDDPSLSPTDVHEERRVYIQRYLRRIYYGNLPAPLVDAAGARVRNSDGSEVGIARRASDPADPSRTVQRRYSFEVVFDYGDWGNPADTAAEEITVIGYLPAPVGSSETFGRDATSPGGAVIPAPVRPDAFSSFRAGFEVRTLRRCRRILAYHHLRDRDNQLLVKATHLNYRPDPHTLMSSLESIVVAGYRRKPRTTSRLLQKSLPPITFRYNEFQPTEQKFKTIEARGDHLPPAGLQHPEFALVDLFGDGMPDVLHAGNSGYRYWRNLGNGLLDMPQPLAMPGSLEYVPAGLSLAQPGIGFGDVDGDGRLELLVQSGPLHGFFESTPEGAWQTFRAITEPLSVEANDPNLRHIDLTGDGLADLLLTYDHHFIWFQCLGEAGYSKPQAIERIANLEEFPDIYFNDASGRVRLADMTGDGLADIVLIHHGRVDYWPNLGYGRFGKRITMGTIPEAPDLDALFDPARLFLADLDGSGCADLVYVGVDEVHFWFNQSGNTWSKRERIPGTPYSPTGTGIEFADIFGTGTATLVWTRDLGTIPGGNYFALDFCGGVKPYLLVEMDNQMGATTRVSYAPSTRFALEDAAKGMPWVTSLPFPVHVVDKVEVIDRISRTRHTTTYRYRHGYFDGREREFRGFGCVEQEDTEVFEDFVPGTVDGAIPQNTDAAFHVPPVRTRTWFHTGAWIEANTLADKFRSEFWQEDKDAFQLDAHSAPDDPEAMRALRGAVLRTEVYALDQPLSLVGSKAGNPFVVTENRYRVKELQPRGANQHAVYHTSQADTLTWHYERISDDPRIAHEITFEPDAFGNVTDKIAIAYPRRKPDPNILEQGETKFVYTKADYIHASPAGAWFNGILAQNRVFEISNAVAARPDGRYQQNDFTALISDLAAPYALGSWKAFHEKPLPASASKRLIEWTRVYFRKDTSAGTVDPLNTRADRLPLGAIESLALPYETLQAVFTDGLVGQVYGSRVDNALLDHVGYIREADVPNHWWLPSERTAFDSRQFFLPTKSRDPFGNITTLTYDSFALLLESATDALGNQTLANNDYRVLQPDEVTSPNGHVAQAAYDALGRLAGTALRSRTGEGDTLTGFEADPPAADIAAFLSNPRTRARALLGNASTRLIYDLHAFAQRRSPVFHVTVAREQHASENPNSPVVITFAYSDGFGRDAQTKVQAEPDRANPGPRWVASGWIVYNNKGKPVRQFEPFFSPTHAFDFNIRQGVSPYLFYDPLGRVIGTLKPDYSWEKVVFDPWKQTSHDAHDTLLIADPGNDPDLGLFFNKLPRTEWSPTWHELRTNSVNLAEFQAQYPDATDRLSETTAATNAAAHAATPAVVHFDVLARPLLAVADLGGARFLNTRTSYDIQGNVVAITDPRGIVAFEHAFDMAKRQLAVISVDAGHARALPDVAGAPTVSWDANGHKVLVKYDELRRPTERWLRRGAGNYHLTQTTLYGESAGAPPAGSLRGQVWKVYDGAGLQENQQFDFKNNLVQATRTLCRDPLAQPEWGVNADPLLHVFDESAALASLDPAHAYTTLNAYDALNRIVRTTAPDGSVQAFIFNEASFLNSVTLRHRGAALVKTVVSNIDYDAKGQRTRIEYGNGVATDYSYNDKTFRLTRLRTRRASGRRRLLQDLRYTYDAVSNITRIQDDAFARTWFANQIVDPVSTYRYDALYRLSEATGREHISMGACHYSAGDKQQTEFIQFTPQGQPVSNARALANYTQQYTYDDGGNITEMRHRRGSATRWVRTQTYEPGSNRIIRSSADCVNESARLTHDENGNLLKLAHLPELKWNDRNQLIGLTLNVATSPDTTTCHYDAAGQRLRKTLSRQNGNRVEERIYLGGFELFLVRTSAGLIERWETLHVSDGDKRIAIVETETSATNTNQVLDQLTRMQFGNHLGSAVLETDDSPSARCISYEEFTAYGETAYIAGMTLAEVRRKRYRYSGKERDNESGLCYYGARYLVPWMGRWVSCDPLSVAAGLNCYCFCSNSPIVLLDTNGCQDEPTTDIEAEVSSWKSTISTVEFIEGQGVQIQFHIGPTLEGLPKIDIDNLDIEALQQKFQTQERDLEASLPPLGAVFVNNLVDSAVDLLLFPLNYMRLDPESDLTGGDLIKDKFRPFPYTQEQEEVGKLMDSTFALVPSPGSAARIGKLGKLVKVGTYQATKRSSKRGVREADHPVADSISPFPKNKGLAILLEYKDHRGFLTTGSKKEAKAFRESLRSIIEADPIDGYHEVHLIVMQLYYEEFGLKYADAMYESIELLDALGISEPIYK